mgnify:CR=1 FL=1
MAIQWSQKLAVGVDKIDEQHKVLCEKANLLFEAGKAGKAKEYISDILNFLDEYTKQHFADEEAYMESIGYPGLEEQKAAHAGFITVLNNLKKDYEESGGNIALVINLNQVVVDWLINHISNMDKKIGDYKP